MKRRSLPKCLAWIIFLVVLLLTSSVSAWADDDMTGAQLLASRDKNNIIDLGGKTITIITSEYKQTSEDITIKNGILSSEVTDFITVSGEKAVLTLDSVRVVRHKGAAVYVEAGAKLIIEDSSIDYGNYGFAETTTTVGENTLVYVHGDKSELVMNSGLILGDDGNHVTLHVAYGGKATINGGRVLSRNSTTIAVTGANAEIIINDGVVSTDHTMDNINGYVAGYARGGGKITVNGGVIYSNNWAALSAIYFGQVSGGTVEVNGGLIHKAVGAYEKATNENKSTSRLIITGGTIGNNSSWGICVYSGASADVTGGSIKGYVSTSTGGGSIDIRGGSFDRKPYSSATIASGYTLGQPSTNGYYIVTDANGLVSKPHAIPYPFYSGQAQPLITAGIVSPDYTMKYGIGTADAAPSSYSEEIPTATEAGTYYVYYTIEKPTDNNATAASDTSAAIPVTIHSIDIKATAPAESPDLVYTGSAQELITAGSARSHVGTYSSAYVYYTTSDDTVPVDDDYSTNIPAATNAGKYHIWYKINPTNSGNYSNYNSFTVSSFDVEIAKAEIVSITAPKAKTMTYTGEELELIEAGSVKGVSDDTLALLYAATTGTDAPASSAYSTDIPTQTNAGTYHVWYKPEPSTNYNEIAATSMDVKISPATLELTVTPIDRVYDGQAHALVEASTPKFGTVEYSLDGVEYVTTIPVATDAGKYTVSYKIESTDNYTGIAPASVTATISKLGTSSATDEDVDAAKGSAATSAVTVGGYTSSQTLTTTAISLGGVQVLSVDVAITVVSMDDEKDFAITTIGEFSRTVSVDVKLDFNPNFDTSSYSSYVYSMDVTGLPEGITVSGTVSSTDEEIQTEYHHVFTISGTPTTAGSNLVDMLATITISGDAPALVATASKDISIDVTYEAPTLTGLAAAITDAAVTAYRGTASSTALGVTVTGSYNDGSTATLEAGSYSVAWTTASVDVEGISLDNAGSLSVTAIAPLNVYAFPVSVTATVGELSAQTSGVVTVTVSNAAPALGVYATISNADGDTSYSTENIIARVGDSVDIRVYDTSSTESISWTGNGILPAGLASSDSAYSFRITGAISLTAALDTYTYVVTASNDIGSDDVTISIMVEEAPKQQLIVAVDDVAEVITVTADADTILSMPTEQLIEALTATTSGSSSGSGGTGSETKTAKLVLTSNVAVNEQTLSAIVEKLNDTGVQNIELDLSSVVGLTAVDLSSTKNTSITTLTIGSDNTEIKSVNVENNSVITTVNLAGSGVREVKANGSTITEINVEGCADLEELDISDTEVGGQLNLTGCGSLQTLNTGGCGNLTSIEGLQDCAATLEELDVNGNSLLELNLRGFTKLTNPKLYGQKRNNWVQTRRFSLWDFFRSLSMWIAEEGEETAQTENYADKVKILSAEDSLGNPVTWTVDADGNVEFSRTPTTFKYDFDTGLAQTEVGAPEFMASENEKMDVTISTENPTDDITKPGESSSGGSGGCNAGFGLLALAVMAFTKRKN